MVLCFVIRIFQVLSHIFLLYNVLQVIPYHRISLLLSVFSFLDFYDIFFFEDSDLFGTLLAIVPFFYKPVIVLLVFTMQ